MQNSIADQTLDEHYEKIELIAANLNSLYGLLSTLNGSLPNIFPIKSKERAQKFMVIAYSINSFHFASTINDLLINGQYPEASALVRSLIESVAFAEYCFHKPDSAYMIVKDFNSLPKRKAIFRFLKNRGNYPKGGPRQKFEHYNLPTHGALDTTMSHWTHVDDDERTTQIWIRRYNSESFRKISRDIFVPLLGIQELFRALIIDDSQSTNEESWKNYWDLGHDREKTGRAYPSLVIGENADHPYPPALPDHFNWYLVNIRAQLLRCRHVFSAELKGQIKIVFSPFPGI